MFFFRISVFRSNFNFKMIMYKKLNINFRRTIFFFVFHEVCQRGREKVEAVLCWIQNTFVAIVEVNFVDGEICVERGTWYFCLVVWKNKTLNAMILLKWSESPNNFRSGISYWGPFHHTLKQNIHLTLHSRQIWIRASYSQQTISDWCPWMISSEKDVPIGRPLHNLTLIQISRIIPS